MAWTSRSSILLAVNARRGPATALEAFNELEAFLVRCATAHTGLPELERACELRGREVCRLALQAHLDSRGDGDIGPALLLQGPDGPVRLTHKRPHTRRLLTIFGQVQVTRLGYGAKGQASVHPLDAELPDRSYSYEICRRLTKAAVCGPFAEAISFIAEMTGVAVPMRSAEAIVADAAADFDAFYASRAAKTPARGEILVGAIDCKGIPMVKPEPATKVVRRGKGQKAAKKKMATVAAVFSQRPRVRTAKDVLDSLFASLDAVRPERRTRPTAKRVWASLTAGKDSFIAAVRAEMRRRDPHHRRTWVMVTDGEPALQRRVTTSFQAVGSVESACKNLVRVRMERSGMRWTPQMAEPMLQMRATYLSDDFDAYWQFHVEQEQQRLYHKDRWRVVRK